MPAKPSNEFIASTAERLVIEVDGAYHVERARADAKRDAVLARAGYRVLRFEAEIVMREIDAAVAHLRSHV